MGPTLPIEEFRERLLTIMDQKHHWAWPHFSGSQVTKAQLNIHYRQEYAVYVRDFPVLLARVYGNHPPHDARCLLAENIYEEDTGRLSLGRSHPALFLSMMEGLGYDQHDFADVPLLPDALRYREWLDQTSAQPQWVLGAAALTIFVEGSVHDRQALQQSETAKTQAEIEDAVSKHPLVQHHGLSPKYLDLIRAHQMVETGHRHAAYHMVLTHAGDRKVQEAVLACLNHGLGLWFRYRDGVARACGLAKI